MAKTKEIEVKQSELEQISGCGPATIDKLSSNGISTLMALAVSSPANIADMCGISENVARKLIQNARDNLKLGFEVASEYAKKRDKVKKLGTGCSDFDNMLGGGFESKSITEVYGRTSSGKTQLSHLMVIRALLENKENKAIYLDSESTFREERIKDFAEANELAVDDVMSRIFIARSYNPEHQMLLVDEIEKMLQKDNTYRILVIDSLTSHFRANFSGRGELASRQQLLNKHLHQLLRIADIYNMIVIVTNQVSSNPGVMYGNPEQPIGGNIMSHSATSIVYLRPSKAGTWAAKLVDSPSLPQTECNYIITKEGFTNI